MHQDEEIIRLLRDIANSFSNHMNRCYECYGITNVQYIVLMELAVKQTCSLKDLACLLHMSPSNLSAIVKRMEQHELLQRERDPNDERSLRIGLKEKAYCILEQMNRDMHCREPITSGLSEKEKADIIRCLRLLNEVIQKETDCHE